MRILLPVLLIALSCLSAEKAFTEQREDVVLVVVEGLSLERILDGSIPGLQEIFESGTVALVNNRTGSRHTPENAAVTIGAGVRGNGGDAAVLAFNADEQTAWASAKEVFESYTLKAVEDNTVVHVGFPRIHHNNEAFRYSVTPGLLGELLRESGARTFVFGNSDGYESPSRSAAVIAATSSGLISGGDVGADTNIIDPERPFGLRTNYEYILEQIRTLPFGRNFVVVEAGDTRRVEFYSPHMLPTQYAQMKLTAFGELSGFLLKMNDMLKQTSSRYLLIVLVTGRDPEAGQGNLLTPALFTGTDFGQGFAVSDTTRRKGLITNLDIAPTVLVFFDLDRHPTMSGSPVGFTQGQNTLGFLQTSNSQMVTTYNSRPAVIMGFVLLAAVLSLMLAVTLIVREHPADPIRTLARPVLLRSGLCALMLTPALLLILPLTGIRDTGLSLLVTGVIALTAGFALQMLFQRESILFTVCGLLISGVICLDQILGGNLAKTSLISYDPIAGLRFYGIGNEFSGVLIGSLLLGAYAWGDMVRSRIIVISSAVLLCAGAVVVAGSPAYGTNFGGLMAALAGFGVAFVKACGVRWRSALIGAGFTVLVILGGLLAINAMQVPDKQTHIGRAILMAGEMGPAVLVDIAIRKWEMNFRLLQTSTWSIMLSILTISAILLYWRAGNAVRKVLHKRPMLNAGLTGTAAGLIVAMVTNDSGVAMAATGMIYLSVPLIIAVLPELRPKEQRPVSRRPSAHVQRG